MRILFVCMGNICRSPLAKGILEDKLAKKNIRAMVDSAGLELYHIGENPDKRAIQIAKKHGIDISKHIARRFSVTDFDKFERIFVMDNANFRDVSYLARNEFDKKRIDYVMNVLYPGKNLPIQDPYYGAIDGFEKVYQLLDEVSDRIVEELENME